METNISNQNPRLLQLGAAANRVDTHLSIVIPMFNEADSLEKLFSRLEVVIAGRIDWIGSPAPVNRQESETKRKSGVR